MDNKRKYDLEDDLIILEGKYRVSFFSILTT